MIVNTWTAVEVRALREAALRMTREQFAERLGWATSTVQKWEHGGSRAVLGDRAATLDTTLAELSSEQLARFTAALTEAESDRSRHPGTAAATSAADEEHDMRRRTLGTLALAAAATSLAPARVGGSDAIRLEGIAAELSAAAQRSGGVGLVGDAQGALDRGLALLDSGTFDGDTGRMLMSAVGHLATTTGWLAYDSHQHALARRCFTEALSLAATADDDGLIARACLTASSQPISSARNGQCSASRALPLISRAADAMHRKPPSRIHALIAVREASALVLQRHSALR
ncbi:helix-turn-helix domain-containing protein [Nocardia sp. NBC_01377]|uniref:helix-turn-helix domain-containing protein n=1 Tax=Nocardia sp. NBC_01377 TaxID=2903595 RepID=UPI003250692C